MRKAPRKQSSSRARNSAEDLQAGSPSDDSVFPGGEAHVPGVTGPSRQEQPRRRASSSPSKGTDPRHLSSPPSTIFALGPTRSAAMLIGATAVMTAAALALRFDHLFNAAPTRPPFIAPTVVGAAMIALSIGVRLPQRIAVWVCANAWRRVVLREDAAPFSELLLGDVRTDRHLYWTVLSVVALGAGVLVATLPAVLGIASFVYMWLQAHFLWPAGPLALLQAAIVFTSTFLPMAMLGIAISCTHHLCCRYGHWETAATAWLIIGSGIGAAAFATLRHAALRDDLLLITGALPTLVLSLLAAISCSRREPEPNDQESSAHLPAPISGLQRPRTVRIGIVCAASTAACLLGVSLSYGGYQIADRMASLTFLLTATGLGALAGCRHARRNHLASPSIGTFGITCVCAGTLAGLSTLCSELIPRPLALAAAGVGVAAAGLAMAHGRRALIQRVANRSSSGAIILARSLMYAGLTVWIFTPTTVRVAGTLAPPLLLALVLLVVGGSLASREPELGGRDSTDEPSR